MTTQYTPHVSDDEMACRCGCGFGRQRADVSPVLLDALESLRALAGDKPLHVNSGCRCPCYNASVGGAPHSYHIRGEAADIAHDSPGWLAEIARSGAGFSGVIIYPWGVHVDVRKGPRFFEDRR
jgi:uncharacterized protein YcbK (DUF882 family)